MKCIKYFCAGMHTNDARTIELYCEFLKSAELKTLDIYNDHFTSEQHKYVLDVVLSSKSINSMDWASFHESMNLTEDKACDQMLELLDRSTKLNFIHLLD